MQDVAPNQSTNDLDEPNVSSMDNVDTKDVVSASAASIEQPEATIPTISPDPVQTTPTEEELAQQEKEEQKKKRRELKNIFRQF
ncbi:hypothetical protein KA037_03775 [Patescibacteria group bacterium]|nr:hypothetical protein [Patescibacteria group bacterium]